MSEALPSSLVMDLKSIPFVPKDEALSIVSIEEKDGFFLDRRFTDDPRIRAPIYQMMKEALQKLPEGLYFSICEAYRPLSKQIKMWDEVRADLHRRFPDVQGRAFEELAETFIASPYDGIGSGHQAACALDLTVCDAKGNHIDMGAPMHVFDELTWSAADGISAEARRNRDLLKDVMESVGFINYPPEWWHFSFGDHQWAWLAKKSPAFYGPLDLPAL